MNELSELSFIETPLMDRIGFLQLLLRFLFNLLVVSVILRCFYYPKSKRRDYYFTFTLISISETCTGTDAKDIGTGKRITEEGLHLKTADR